MNTPRWKRNRLFAAAATAGLAVAMTACGTEPQDDDLVPPPVLEDDEDDLEEDGDEAPSLEVLSPAAEDVVTVPFDVTVDTDAELGPIDDELHHIHVWFDEPGDEPNVVESTTGTVDGQEIVAPDGDTTMIVQIHTYDHEPLGDPVEIPLTVEAAVQDGGGDTGGGDDGGQDTGGGDDDGGYSY